MSKINLQEPQRNRNATANFVNLIRTSTVSGIAGRRKWNICTCQITRKSGLLEIHLHLWFLLKIISKLCTFVNNGFNILGTSYAIYTYEEKRIYFKQKLQY